MPIARPMVKPREEAFAMPAILLRLGNEEARDLQTAREWKALTD